MTESHSNAPLSEQYRYAGEDWADKEAAAQLLEDLKTTVMAHWQAELGDIPVNRAEQQVKIQPRWTEYIEKMVAARKQANVAKVTLESLRMKFAENQSHEANARIEMKMTS